MLAILYLIISCFLGYYFIKLFLPSLFKVSKVKSLFDKPIKIHHWMVTVPASFLIGTMILTWSTYLISYLFKNTQKPLLFGNVFSIIISLAIIIPLIIKNKKDYEIFFREKNYQLKMKENAIEIILIFAAIIISSFLMFYTFNIKNGKINVGVSVFSDFGPHLALIRSFSYGSNFPTQYPHFPDGSIRYHFLFQFLAGNLEFLGMRLDWAFNLPSILSLVSLFMLFYSFVVVAFGEKLIGIIGTVLFFFRSSFASFTFLTEFSSKKQPISNLLKTNKFIGNTTHEDWGLFAQNVYVNQRHLAFSLALLMLTLIIVLPLFQQMILAINEVREKLNIKSETKKYKFMQFIKTYLKELFINKEAWIPFNWKTSASLGVVLGLMGFWNGAVLIAALSILFFLALYSKHRLDYVILAVISVVMFYAEIKFFTKGNVASQGNLIYIGFLAKIPDDLVSQMNGFVSNHNYISLIKILPELLKYIIPYYIEVLGILPIIITIVFFTFSEKFKWVSVTILTPLIVYIMFNLTPNFEMFTKIILTVVILCSTLILIIYQKERLFPKGVRWLIIVFSIPLIVATTLQLTPDIAVNHKYVMVSSMLLSIIAAIFIYLLLKSKDTIILAIIILITMTSTGVIDFITLYNENKPSNAVVVQVNDPVTLWVKKNTNPKDILLTDVYCINPILMAGRSIFFGWPYFAWSAGYDTLGREKIVKQIYGGTDSDEVKKLVKENHINYIVIDDGNRQSETYKLNEELIKDTFTKVYDGGGVTIYKTGF
ncbi:MAG: hypothetical protein Q8900_13250 [Bacillota bacterium]|nr:hypothetical protein [Bacillota bacterium]